MKKLFGVLFGLVALFGICGTASAAEISQEAIHQGIVQAIEANQNELVLEFDGEADKSGILAMLTDETNQKFYLSPELFNYTRLEKFGVRKLEQGYAVIIQLQHVSGRETATARAQEIYAGLVASGKLHDGMTQTERARVLAQAVCDIVEYRNTNDRTCHIGYGALVNGIAVCDGYASALNLLLHLDGIESRGVKGRAFNETHEWNLAKLDGNWVHIDTVGMDKNPGMYFALSDAAMSATHSW